MLLCMSVLYKIRDDPIYSYRSKYRYFRFIYVEYFLIDLANDFELSLSNMTSIIAYMSIYQRSFSHLKLNSDFDYWHPNIHLGNSKIIKRDNN